PSILLSHVSFYSLFFTPTPRPPCSTLFPYTTLFRSMLGPLLLIAHESLTRRWLAPPQQPYDAIEEHEVPVIIAGFGRFGQIVARDRKSTRLNSSHVAISYAVFCLKKKKREISVSAVE